MRPLHLLVWPASPGEAVQKVVQLQKSKIGTNTGRKPTSKRVAPSPRRGLGQIKKILQGASCLFLSFWGDPLPHRAAPGLYPGSPQKNRLLINIFHLVSAVHGAGAGHADPRD